MLRRYASPTRAESLFWFLQMGPGGYGEGDKALGLTMPRIRAIARDCGALTLADVEALLESPYHETRILAVVLLAHRYPRGDAATRQAIYRLYLRRTDRINNWDLVDISAPHVVGSHVLTRPRSFTGWQNRATSGSAASRSSRPRS